MAASYLVTGGAGFIGRHLCDDLLQQGHHVRVVDSLVPQVHGEAVAQLPNDVEFIDGDVRDGTLIRHALNGMDGVFHLAAEVGVGQSMYEIARYVGGNDLGTAVLLENMLEEPHRRLVVASSMSVYGEGLYRSATGAPFDQARRSSGADTRSWDPVATDGSPLEPIPTDETKPVDLASIYALTKYAQERSCLITGAAYGLDTVALRLFNVFGPGQALSNPYTGVLANFGSRLLHDQAPIVFEDGRQQRDFVHVQDVVRAFRLAMGSKAAAGHVINIGSGRAYRIAYVAEILAQAMGKPHLEPRLLEKARAGDIRHCFADIGKARELLSFEPERFLETSLDELAGWIRDQQAQDLGEAAKRQLEVRGLVA